MNNRFSKKDLKFCYFIIFLCLCSAMMLFLMKTIPGDKVNIYCDGMLYGSYSLSEDNTITLSGNVITVDDGVAYMSSATCPDGLCMKMGKIRADKETIVCLPHKVVVEVVSDEKSKLDAVTK